MKRFIICLLAISPLFAQAQKIKSGNLDFLKGEWKLHTEIDFSQAQYVGDQGYGQAILNSVLESDSSALLKRFYTAVTDELDNRYFLVGNQPDAKYKAIMYVQQVTANGKVYSIFIFSPIDSDENLCTMEVIGDGGHFGTFLNLFGDGMKDAGEIFGKVLRKKSK